MSSSFGRVLMWFGVGCLALIGVMVCFAVLAYGYLTYSQGPLIEEAKEAVNGRMSDPPSSVFRDVFVSGRTTRRFVAG